MMPSSVKLRSAANLLAMSPVPMIPQRSGVVTISSVVRGGGLAHHHSSEFHDGLTSNSSQERPKIYDAIPTTEAPSPRAHETFAKGEIFLEADTAAAGLGTGGQLELCHGPTTRQLSNQPTDTSTVSIRRPRRP